MSARSRKLGVSALFRELQELAQQTCYPLDAFLFVQQGLDFTARRIHGAPRCDDDDAEHASRHVTGQQLCLGLRDYAIKEYGLLARTVLRRWNIQRSEDFGRIVFAMVENDLMHKTDHDDLADFIDVFDFDEAFCPSLQLSERP